MERKGDVDDPLGIMGKSSIAMTLKAARASLKDPSRPITPLDPARKLFSGNDYGSKRPESSYGLPNSRVFLEAIHTTRPTGNLPPLDPMISAERPKEEWAKGSTPRKKKKEEGGPPASPRLSRSKSEKTSSETLDCSTGEVVRTTSDTSDRKSGPAEEGGAAEPAAEVDALGGNLGATLQGTLEAEGLGSPSGKKVKKKKEVTVEEDEETTRRNLEQYHMRLKGEAPVQDERLSGTLQVLNEEHEAWCTDVEESLDDMSQALSRPPTASDRPRTASNEGDDPEPLVTALEALRGLIDRGSKAFDWKRWLVTPGSQSMTGVSPRDSMLHQLFRVMDCRSPTLLLKACSIVLKISPADYSTLKNTYKVLFRLSKDAKNDVLFRRENVLPLLIDILGEDAESAARHGKDLLVYVAGTLKNISTDATNQKAMMKYGVMPTLLNLLRSRCSPATAMSTSEEQPRPRSATGAGRPPTSRPASSSSTDAAAQLAVQVTGILRNLSVIASHADKFLEAEGLAVLALIVQRFVRHTELMLNVARILSKVSVSDECRRAMGRDEEFVRQLLQLLRVHPDNASLALRIGFMLGNLTLANNHNRYTIGVTMGGVDLFIALVSRYVWSSPSKQAAGAGAGAGEAGKGKEEAGASGESKGESKGENQVGRAEEGGSGGGEVAESSERAGPKEEKDGPNETEQVLVKLIRVLANMAIHPEVGPKIAESKLCSDALLAILERWSLAESEELVLNVVGAITNLTFYEGEGANEVMALRGTVPRHITPLLVSDNAEAVVEASRAFGNFSRHPEVREYMARARVDEALALLLDHSSRDVLYSVCGVVMNLSTDVQHWRLLGESGGITKLVDLLDRCLADQDLPLATLICKALFNMCISPADGGTGGGAAVARALGGAQPAPEEDDHACFSAPEVEAVVNVLTAAMGDMEPKVRAAEAAAAAAAGGGPASPSHAAAAEEAAEARAFVALAGRLREAVAAVPTCADHDDAPEDDQDLHEGDDSDDLEVLSGPPSDA